MVTRWQSFLLFLSVCCSHWATNHKNNTGHVNLFPGAAAASQWLDLAGGVFTAEINLFKKRIKPHKGYKALLNIVTNWQSWQGQLQCDHHCCQWKGCQASKLKWYIFNSYLPFKSLIFCLSLCVCVSLVQAYIIFKATWFENCHISVKIKD